VFSGLQVFDGFEEGGRDAAGGLGAMYIEAWVSVGGAVGDKVPTLLAASANVVRWGYTPRGSRLVRRILCAQSFGLAPVLHGAAQRGDGARLTRSGCGSDRGRDACTAIAQQWYVRGHRTGLLLDQGPSSRDTPHDD